MTDKVSNLLRHHLRPSGRAHCLGGVLEQQARDKQAGAEETAKREGQQKAARAKSWNKRKSWSRPKSQGRGGYGR